MKRNWFYLSMILLVLGFYSSCSNEDPEVPPTLEEIIAEYTGENLVTSIVGGEAPSNQAKVELVASETPGKVIIKLINIVPGVAELSIPDAEFSTATKSSYVSRLKGEICDDLAGYLVQVEGTVDQTVLTVKVTLTELKGKNIDASTLHELVYKGTMTVLAVGAQQPIASEQRVYVTKATEIADTHADTSMVKLTANNVTFQGVAMGDFELDQVLIQKRGDVLGFKERRVVTVEQAGDIQVDLVGTIVDDQITLKLELLAGTQKAKIGFTGVSVVEQKEARIANMVVTCEGVVTQSTTGTVLTLIALKDATGAQLTTIPVFELVNKTTIDSITLHRSGHPTALHLSDEQIAGTQPIDFSLLTSKGDYLKYWLAAEDPNEKGSFTIKLERLTKPVTTFLFDGEWTMTDPVGDGSLVYYEPKGWASSNQAAIFMHAITDENGDPLYPANTPFPISQKETDAMVITVDTKGMGEMIPAITAGSLFLGTFEINIFNTLMSTKFGIKYDMQPIVFKGAYKYTAGPIYYRVTHIDPVTQVVTKEEVVGKVDLCAISAILYEVTDYTETLDGTNLFTAPNIVATAVISTPTTAGYVEFNEPMLLAPGKTYDPTKKYKLALACSSSDKGAEFEGAPGSTLLIKSLEIVNK